jgi:hypothetical protein
LLAGTGKIIENKIWRQRDWSESNFFIVSLGNPVFGFIG